MKKEEIAFVENALNSLQGAILRLRRFYEIYDKENFIKTKKAMLQIEKQIEDTIK